MSSGGFSGVTSDGQGSFVQDEARQIAAENEERLAEEMTYAAETTAAVWNYISPTQENYGGTVIPRSFSIQTPAGKMWTHGNATKHMYDALISTRLRPPMLKNSHPNLYAQFILYDYYKELGEVVRSGITYNKTINTKHWEFIFSPARVKGGDPVVKHAKFRGL